MPRILVFYGTTDGHTRLIAEAIGDTLRMGGYDADVVLAGSADPTPASYGGVIVAASIHAGGYQKAVEHWVMAHARQLDALPTAFVSAGLAVVKPSPRVTADLDAIVARFIKRTGWQPARVKHVAGALLYTRYNVFKRWLMKRITASHGGDTDTSRDYDYTNWHDLALFAEEFSRHIRAAA